VAVVVVRDSANAPSSGAGARPGLVDNNPSRRTVCGARYTCKATQKQRHHNHQRRRPHSAAAAAVAAAAAAAAVAAATVIAPHRRSHASRARGDGVCALAWFEERNSRATAQIGQRQRTCSGSWAALASCIRAPATAVRPPNTPPPMLNNGKHAAPPERLKTSRQRVRAWRRIRALTLHCSGS
jgi:hypothetical protein